MIVAKTILDRAYLLLEDEAHDVWTTAELLQWLNDAVTSVVNHRPDAYIKRAIVDLQEGTYQTLPEDAMMLVRVTRNLSTHSSITGVPLDIMDDQNPSWRMPVLANVVQHYLYSDKDPKHFEVFPSVAEGVQIELDYGAMPPEVSLETHTIPLGKEYVNILVDWVLYRAWSKDDEAADLNKATLHFQAFSQALGIKSQMQQAIIPDTKNAVGVQGASS
ncbi:phage adaptor protein [Vibrio jasicida]|uniref:phage adaptor protein n=1 Tax=Vibrio jasicida TaxID=766224 RepID=UPI0005EF2023|nr:DUF6682 family protein [Vibrio jasicida]